MEIYNFSAVLRTCFKCARCRTQLNVHSYYETEGGDYCCDMCPDEEKNLADTVEANKKIVDNHLDDNNQTASAAKSDSSSEDSDDDDDESDDNRSRNNNNVKESVDRNSNTDVAAEEVKVNGDTSEVAEDVPPPETLKDTDTNANIVEETETVLEETETVSLKSEGGRSENCGGAVSEPAAAMPPLPHITVEEEVAEKPGEVESAVAEVEQSEGQDVREPDDASLPEEKDAAPAVDGPEPVEKESGGGEDRLANDDSCRENVAGQEQEAQASVKERKETADDSSRRISYPVDMNPFGDDYDDVAGDHGLEEAKKTPSDQQNEEIKASSTNPFGSDFDDSDGDENQGTF